MKNHWIFSLIFLAVMICFQRLALDANTACEAEKTRVDEAQAAYDPKKAKVDAAQQAVVVAKNRYDGYNAVHTLRSRNLYKGV